MNKELTRVGMGENGDALTLRPHVSQSIRRILSTPKGSLVMAREFGSDLWKLVDNPTNDITRIRIYQETAAAILKWEPRVELKKISIESVSVGHITVNVEFVLLGGEHSVILRAEI